MKTTIQIVDFYFKRLNWHRPVFYRSSFMKQMEDLYAGKGANDPGFFQSFYLILALGTLSELNHRAIETNMDSEKTPFTAGLAKDIMPKGWPLHDEFFNAALSVEYDLRVSLSSLQGQILMHWYLYTEVRVQ